MPNVTALTPLFRQSVGFDRFSDLFDAMLRPDEQAATPSYPPYNIVKLGEDDYRITMAVAGFRQDDVTITAHNNQLIVQGKIADAQQEDGATYLYKGIATRAFERKFSLADHVKVVGASMADGLLHIELKREVPESSKPKLIPINGVVDGVSGVRSKKQ